MGSVLISGGCLAKGGVGTHLMLLCSVLRDAGADVSLVATGSDWSVQELGQLQQMGVHLFVHPLILAKLRKVALAQSMICLPFQVRKNFSKLYCISTGRSHIFLRKIAPSHISSVYHEVVEAPSKNSLGGQCISVLGNVIANSKNVARGIAKTWPDVPVEVIPFLTSENSSSTPLLRTFEDSTEIRIAYIGRVVSHKRPDRLVKDWQHISLLHPLRPARLDIYGDDLDGELLNELSQFINQNGMSDSVYIHGAYNNAQLDEILSSVDLVVLPSLWEGLPLVLVEAMKRGVPILATNTGGTQELAEDNPDVMVTDIEWDSFLRGLLEMSARIRSNKIDSIRLRNWTESRYGFRTTAEKWKHALLSSV